MSVLILGIAFPYEYPHFQKMLLGITLLLFFISYKFKFEISDRFTVLCNLFTSIFLILLVFKIGYIEYDPRSIKDVIKNLGAGRFKAGDSNFDLNKLRYYSKLNLASRADDIQLKDKPNIYHFILDAYSSDKILRDIYGYDNSSFSNELKNLGFYVSENVRSTSNQTASSVPSIFYKSNIFEEDWSDDIEKLPSGTLRKGSEFQYSLIGFGKVHTELRNNGYSFARAVEETRQFIFPPIYSTYKDPNINQKYNVFEHEFFKRRFYWD